MTSSPPWGPESSARTPRPALDRDLHVDVAIVGAGITGLTLADRLRGSGLRVAVFEARTVGDGVTGHSTGQLTELVDARYARVQERIGADRARLLRSAVRGAIDFIGERTGDRARFRRVPAYLVATAPDQVATLDRELDAARAAGVPVERATTVPLPFPTEGAIRVTDQAEFDPKAHCEALADDLMQPGSHVELYEHTRVRSIDHGEPCRLRIGGGAEVTAREVVLATHTPLGLHHLQTVVAPYRSFVIGCRVRPEQLPDGLVFDLESPYHYLRTYENGGERRLLVGGADHKTGHAEGGDPFDALEAWARRRYGDLEVVERWTAEVFEAADGLPSIGRSPLREHFLVATGFGGDGLVYGTLAGLILADELLATPSPIAASFAPARFGHLRGAATLVKENVDVAKRFIVDRFKSHPGVAEVRPGSGAIVEVDGDRVAAYRSEDGALRLMSAVCPHMGCIVQWSEAGRTWDCPCHGARYSCTGEVLSGPALHGLELAES